MLLGENRRVGIKRFVCQIRFIPGLEESGIDIGDLDDGPVRLNQFEALAPDFLVGQAVAVCAPAPVPTGFLVTA